jgi:rod shape determining protein RodA
MFINKIKKHDWIITAIAITLSLLGIIVIYAATINAQNVSQGLGSVYRQIIFLIIGFVIYFLIMTIDFSWFRIQSIIGIFYIIIIGCLVYLRFFGVVIAGTRRWIDLGFFSFQPSEYAKLVIILVTATLFTLDYSPLLKRFNTYKTKKSSDNFIVKNFKKFWNFYIQFHEDNKYISFYIVCAIFTIPILFLTFIQPSLGNTLIILIIWTILLYNTYPHKLLLTSYIVIFLGYIYLVLNILKIEFDSQVYTISWEFTFDNSAFMIGFILLITIAISVLWAKTNIKLLSVLLLIAIISIPSVIYFWNNEIKFYQRKRVYSYISGPEADKTGANFQVLQSKAAIGSGRLLGRGFLEGRQSSLNILTQSHTDFAFATLSEQFGFIGSVSTLLLYLILILKILNIAQNSRNEFDQIVASGIAIFLFTHVSVNIGTNIALLPVTGIPLPLISYGGSSALLIFISLGIVQSIVNSQKSVDIADKMMLRSQSLVL